MAQHRPSRIPFIAHFSDISRSFSVVFGRFWSFFGRFWSFLVVFRPYSHKKRHYRHALAHIQPTPYAQPCALSDVEKPLQPRLHILARLLPFLPLPTVGRHMAVVAEASQIMSIKSQRAHLLPAPARTDRPHVVHLLGRLVHDATGHTLLAKRMRADIGHAQRVPPLRVNNALILLSALAATPVSTTATTACLSSLPASVHVPAALLCLASCSHIDRNIHRE